MWFHGSCKFSSGFSRSRAAVKLVAGLSRLCKNNSQLLGCLCYICTSVDSVSASHSFSVTNLAACQLSNQHCLVAALARQPLAGLSCRPAATGAHPILCTRCVDSATPQYHRFRKTSPKAFPQTLPCHAGASPSSTHHHMATHGGSRRPATACWSTSFGCRPPTTFVRLCLHCSAGTVM
jgi:hypothetical protein